MDATVGFYVGIGCGLFCGYKIKTILSTSLLSVGLLVSLTLQASVPTNIASRFEANKIIPKSILIEAPDIAENGAVVSVKINKINKLPKGVYVTDIILFNKFRDEPVASFKVGPRMLPTGLHTRIKMKASGKIFAIAKLSNGKLFSGEKVVKLTKGGCGGGGGATE